MKPFTLLAVALVCSVAWADSPQWEKIKACFEPPPEFRDQLGAYRPVLKFADGRPVQTREQWLQRRAEILKRWHDVMGPWPALVDKPRVEFIEKMERENFVQHRIQLEIAPGRMQEAYLLVPAKAVRRPAVLVPFYDPFTSIGQPLPGKKGEFRDYAYQLARRGFVTLAIGSPGGDARKPDRGQQVMQPLSFLGYLSANCANALATLPEVDPNRIGVVGHSYGGKWAMFASCLFEKFAVAVWSDPGIVFDEPRGNVNYWEPWYLGLDPKLGVQRKPGLIRPDSPRTGAYKVMMESGMDLHELHALMAPRPFLVSGGAEDPPARWAALNHTIAVNRLLGVEHRVGMHNRKEHSPNEQANDIVYCFFEHFLGK